MRRTLAVAGRAIGRLTRAVAVCLIWGGAALAEAPESSLRPQLRGVESVVVQTPTRPRLRPLSDQVQAAEAPASIGPLTLSLRPQTRPASVGQAIARRQAGAVCGPIEIQGEKIAAIKGRIPGCGIENAVRITSVSGVKLSTAATMDCTTAKALNTWVRKGVQPAVGSKGGGVKQLRVVAHYACRTRNNRAGAKISEHGKGRAIDIAGIGLRDGSEISVLRDWGRGDDGRALRQMWRAACGPFGTVLGPESDPFHKDHFHFDTARYRSGSYCR